MVTLVINFDKLIMPDRGNHIYLGFSGGADSLAALVWLKSGGWNVIPVHVSHFCNTRSHQIELGVRYIWEQLGINNGVVYNLDSTLEPTEANAYTLRNGVWQYTHAPIVLCNHLNDLAEGYFMNCMQGFPSRVPLKAKNGNKLRPFLRTKKKSFLNYLEGRNLTHLIVPDDMISLRGRLRGTVFPTLQDDWTSAARKLFVDTGRIYEEV